MLWEHEPQASVSTAFSSSSKLSRVFLYRDEEKEKQLVYSDHQMCFYRVIETRF